MRAFGGKLTCLNLACGLSLMALSGCADDATAETEASTSDTDPTDGETTEDGSTDTTETTETGDGDGDGDGEGETTGDGDGDGEMTLPDDAERDWYIWTQTADETFVNAIAATTDGIIVLSTRPHTSGEFGTEGVVEKYDFDGNEVWEQVIDSQVPCGSSCSASTELVVTDSGEIIVAGRLRDDSTLRVDALVATFAADGTPGWTQSWSGTQEDGIDSYNDVAVDPNDGSIYVVGSWENDNLFDAMVRKYDSSGTEVWENTGINGAATASSDSLSGVAVAGNGDVVVTGRLQAAGLEGADQLFTARYDSAGNELWSDLHDENASLYDAGVSVDIDGSGNAFVVGTVDSGNTERHDIRFSLHAPDGSETWAHKYDGPVSGDCETQTIFCDFASDGSILADGNFAIVGGVHAEKTDRGAFVGIFNASGSLLWERLVEGEVDFRDSMRAVAEGPDGSLYVGGFLVRDDGSAEGGSDFFLAKYSPSY